MGRVNPLNRFRRLLTHSAEEAEFKLSRSIAKLEFTRVFDRQAFHLEMNEVSLGRTTLHYNLFGAETDIISGPYNDTAFLVVGRGAPTSIYFNNEWQVISPQKAIIVTSAKQIKIKRSKNSGVLILRTSLSDVWQHLGRLTALHHRGALVFDHRVDLTKGSGAMMLRAINYVVNELRYKTLVMKNPGLLKNYDDILLSALLSLPHNQRHKLNPDVKNKVAPGIVHSAEEYMREYLSEPVSIMDLLRICNCSRTVLFSVFKNARGYTPMEFLTEQRLQCARKKLVKHHSATSVAAISLECGFTHLGRFSRVYKKRYGESPSETMHKERQLRH